MADDGECPLTELPTNQCACSKHRGGHAPEDEPIETVGEAFTATYDGVCARRCDDGIQVGDLIARSAHGFGYVHARGCP